jgi:threonine dehydratase
MSDTVSLQDIQQAALRIGAHVHETPVLHSQLINQRLGCDVLFKCENFQKVGAFKARGAVNALAQLGSVGAAAPSAQRAKAVATHSSGNHGAALAYAAGVFGLQAYVVMPSTAPQVKKHAVAAYGAVIKECAPTQADREATLAQVVADTGAQFIPPYDHAHVIAGQGTAALEFMAQLTVPVDMMLAPVGGGGLLAGTAVAVKGLQPRTRVFGTEPAAANDAALGFQRGLRVTDQVPNTIADGLRTQVGVLNFALIQTHVDDILTVSEAAIVDAMALVWTRLKIIIEPSSAVPIAAIMEHPQVFKGKRVGVVISGGNVELSRLPF